MAESRFSKTLLEKFKQKFPEGWIERLDWGDNANESLRTSLSSILEFQKTCFENLARLILSGDHLVHETKSLDELFDLSAVDIVLDDTPSSKSKLLEKYASLLLDIHDSLYLVKYHKDLTAEKFKSQDKNVLIRAIPYKNFRKNRSEYVSLLDDICNACWYEYIFSYDEDYIRNLLILKEKLNDCKKEKDDITISIIDVTINKIILLLNKLSVFSKNKRITYIYDFRETTISLSNDNQYEEDGFRGYFLDFMDVERISSEKILSWQEDSQKDNIKMWQLVFLMRYYVKKTKSKEQIDNLIHLFEKLYSGSVKDETENIVNKFARRSCKNYIYNSRFSYYCQCEMNYTFEQMIDDLAEIERIQNETFIFNYHPYKKAIEYAKRYFDTCKKKNESLENLNRVLTFIKESFEKYKNNVEWCKVNQPYLMQLSFNFSKIKDQDIEVFYPSTFCRPLRFHKLNENIRLITNDITAMEYQISHHSEWLEMLKAKKKIENMEKKNIETLSLVITVTTFLVGLLSIFIGNSDVSIFTKIEYVIALGVVLLMFISFGYFFVSDTLKSWKTIFFGITTAISLAFIIHFLCLKKEKSSDSLQNEIPITMIDSIKNTHPSTIDTVNLP